MAPALHPLFQTGPEWEVTNYPTTVELKHSTKGTLIVIPKPYTPQPAEWWSVRFSEELALASFNQGVAGLIPDWGCTMKAFLNRQRVKVTAEGHPYHGKTGTVWRLLKRDESAWVTMDEDLRPEDQLFPAGDERFRNLNLWPRDCVAIKAEGWTR